MTAHPALGSCILAMMMAIPFDCRAQVSPAAHSGFSEQAGAAASYPFAAPDAYVLGVNTLGDIGGAAEVAVFQSSGSGAFLVCRSPGKDCEAPVHGIRTSLNTLGRYDMGLFFTDPTQAIPEPGLLAFCVLGLSVLSGHRRPRGAAAIGH
ncbi:hypothetical protein HZ994_10335 [Akkermansiaceae bacterium]|nr:hypothetical protein HZ994_10335 [Akkermansiaceae bacterium]